jgi:hypothetical protein
MLGEWIKSQVFKSEREESDRKFTLLCKLPANTFAAIYADCVKDDTWAGSLYNGEYFHEGLIYSASLMRDEGYEAFL